MQAYEYKVVPAPVRGEKERGLKTGVERFAHALSVLMNELGREGWEYWRAETLPAEERSGLTSKTTVFHNLLVFRRIVAAPAGAGQMAAPGAGAAFAALDEAEGLSAAERRARMLTAYAPEGRAPRLGPAEEEEV